MPYGPCLPTVSLSLAAVFFFPFLTMHNCTTTRSSSSRLAGRRVQPVPWLRRAFADAEDACLTATESYCRLAAVSYCRSAMERYRRTTSESLRRTVTESYCRTAMGRCRRTAAEIIPPADREDLHPPTCRRVCPWSIAGGDRWSAADDSGRRTATELCCRTAIEYYRQTAMQKYRWTPLKNCRWTTAEIYLQQTVGGR